MTVKKPLPRRTLIIVIMDRHARRIAWLLLLVVLTQVCTASLEKAIRQGNIPDLVALARDGSDVGKEKAAGALRNLAMNDDNQVAIAAAGGIPVLVSLAQDGSVKGKEHAAAALENLAEYVEEYGDDSS